MFTKGASLEIKTEGALIFVEQLAEMLAASGPGQVLVHSDIARVMKAVKIISNPTLLLERHMDALARVAGPREIWLPTFNYDFTVSGRFDLASSPSQVGALSEYARSHWAGWRTAVPVFSICGRGTLPDLSLEEEIDPFGHQSIFGALCKNRGSVLLYGAPFHTTTSIHHAERLAGGPLYRYDKHFSGNVRDANGNEREVTLLYHVRPKGRHLDYDWPRLFDDLRSAGVAAELRQGSSQAVLFEMADLCKFWVEHLIEDPLYLLDTLSRQWVEPELDRLGRRFVLEDYE